MSPGYDMPPTHDPELEARKVATVAVLDMDRTLLNTDQLAYAMCDMLILHTGPEEDINQHKAHIDANYGNNFSVTDYLAEIYNEEIVELIKEDLLNLAESDELRERLLFPGTMELLDALAESDTPHAILTRGVRKNQEFKLALFRRLVDRSEEELPGEVTTEEYKSEWIHHTWTDEGRIVIPKGFFGKESLQAEQVIVIDDKKDNLLSPDIRVKGILVDNREAPPKGKYSIAAIAELVNQGGKLEALATWYQREAA